jgi:hypothetical protein
MAREVQWVWGLEWSTWWQQVLGEGEEGNKMDDEQGRSLVSFPYSASAEKETNESTVIKEWDTVGLVR